MHQTLDAVRLHEQFEFGSYEVTREEVLEFGDSYDPQAFHVDEEAASESMFGGLIASGWHTAAMTMRLIVDNYLTDSGAIGSPGVDDLRWPAPVRPGDVLRVRAEPVEKEPWNEDMGAVA
ncbi:MAG: MaoC/PaaZ C-terminal domain-containing protein, partial [Haloarculaceae archaeon]